MNRIAECCCGKSQLEVKGDPVIHTVCSCNNCKKRTGSAFGISAYFRRDQIINLSSSELNIYELHNAEQNHDQKRYFCGACGTTLFWYISTYTDMIGIAGGCFIEKPLACPPFSANHNQKCSWVSFAETCEIVQ